MLTSIIPFLAGALSSLILIRKKSLSRLVSLAFAILGSGCLLIQSLRGLFTGKQYEWIVSGLKLIPGFHFYFTPLSAFFTALTSGLSLVASFYALEYSREYEDNAAPLGFFYNLFLLGMCLVPAAQNIFSFLFCWEGMTLASFFLVIIEHQKSTSRRAAYIYLVMSHIGTAFIFLLFFLLYQKTGSMEFDAFGKWGHQIGGQTKNVLFLLALVGFGTKAGIVPLHLWLPYAHPAAPSHVSSLMSGVMVKTAIYGFLLTVFGFLGMGPLWWGLTVLTIAVVSSVIGILYALMENDLKRLLAYSTVENVGIILIGIGAAMIFYSAGYAALAVLVLVAGLYHAVNHAIFKGLLFLGAGSVIKSIHTRNIEKMGGLIKTMPATAFCFLVGSLAISALPPFNGFVSEWMIFQGLFAGVNLPVISARIVCSIAAAGLALTGGLAAACFVKAFGITFLAQPRSESARDAQEAPMSEWIPMAFLAILCLMLGIFPSCVLRVLKPVAEYLIPSTNFSPAFQPLNFISSGYGAVSPMVILILLTVGSFAALVIPRLIGGARKFRIAPTWGCGLKELAPRMEYTATAFSKPFRMLFSIFYRPVREVEHETAGSSYFPTSIQYSSEITYLIKEKIYRPPLKMMLKISHLVRRIQAGSLNLYLGYVLAAVAALLILFVWKGI